MFASYLVSSLSLMVCFAITSFQCLLLADFFGLASFDRCSPKTEACLVASSVGGSLSFLVPFFFLLHPGQQTQLFLFLSSGLLSWLPSPAQPSKFLTGYFNAQVSGFRCRSPAPPHPFWPVILTPGYPVSSSSLPLHLFPFDRLFWRPAIRFLVSLSRSATSSFDRLFWRPAIRFPVPLSRSASPFFDRLFWRPAIRFLFPLPLRRVFPWPAILTPGYPVSGASLPLHSVSFWPAILPPGYPVFGATGPSFHSPFFGRLFRRPPFSHPTFPSRINWVAGSLFVPPYGWPAVFTAPRFLPLRGFYRSVVFTAPRFFTAPLSPVPWGALLFRRPRACCPPVFPPLPGGSLFGPPSGAPAKFTAPRFLPLHGFYRSAVFTAPRFLPLRGFYRPAVFFYRSAIFSAPLSPVLWWALLFLSALQSSPSSGRTLCYRLLRRVSGGTPFLIFFLDHLLNRSQGVTAHLTGFPFCSFHTH